MKTSDVSPVLAVLGGAVVIAAVAIATGCSAKESSGTSGAAATAGDVTDARSALAKGGEFWFVLDESPVVRESVVSRCEKEADAKACVQRIRDAGSREGFRFVPTGSDAFRVVSFGTGEEDGKEEVFWEAPAVVDASATNGHFLTLRLTAPATGTRPPRDPQALTSMTLEVLDPSTVAMDEKGRKGKMVFRRR